MKKFLLVISLALLVPTFVAAQAAAPAVSARTLPVAIETSSGTLTVDVGSGNSVSFTYPGVRHVSLTIAAQITCPCSTNNIVGVLVGFPLRGGGVTLITNSYPELATMEFDAKTWEIDAHQFATDAPLAVVYNYTVMYPVGQ